MTVTSKKKETISEVRQVRNNFTVFLIENISTRRKREADHLEYFGKELSDVTENGIGSSWYRYDVSVYFHDDLSTPVAKRVNGVWKYPMGIDRVKKRHIPREKK